MEIDVHEDTPPIFVVRAECLPQLDAHWMLVQPEVVRTNPMRGWDRVDDLGLYLGSGDNLIGIKLRPEDPEKLCRVSGPETDWVEIENLSDEPLRLVAHHRRAG